ncbi:MAG TPA: deoxyribodipyrimidine photo-lyase [Rhodomicrobium sp.]|nr:deoxyribodipyrimidine photo-lyase [Rhodomicrobium sp.]
MSASGKWGTNLPPAVLVWFRRDLRLADHTALTAAALSGFPIIPVYILDDETPGNWRMGGASRWWLAGSLRSLEKSLQRLGSRLILRRGQTERVFRDLIAETRAPAIYFTRGYEPYQRSLEERLKWALGRSVQLRRFGGQILFEPEKILNASGEPFRVYSPFYRALNQQESPNAPLAAPLTLPSPSSWPISDNLEDWGLEPAKPDWAGGIKAAWTPGEIAAYTRLRLFIDRSVSKYRDRRNNPGSDSTSRLSPYLAFGEISPRQVWHAVLTAAEAAGRSGMGEAYLREIAWREFSYHLLFHFPDLPEKAFRPEFENFPFREDKHALRAWQKGKTGYPIVDAGMRQLWQTGWMHNRVRMIVASFLIKHLLQTWRSGEAWFWDTLVDADLANNSASWQWVAGSGADAAPYFRIFNPVLQGEKFDPQGDYVREFCPELAKLPASLVHKPWEGGADLLARNGVKLGVNYPAPMVAHTQARERALAAFEGIKKQV